jgi:hypothetical protein
LRRSVTSRFRSGSGDDLRAQGSGDVVLPER